MRKPKPTDHDWPGPEYTISSSALVIHRRKAREGLTTLSRAERQTYGLAVETAVRAAQAAQCRRHCEPGHNSPSASGTWHNTGEAIHKAVAAQQRAALLAYPSQVRKSRTDAEWLAMYDAAMEAKRRREAAAAVSAYGKELIFI